MYRRTKKEKGCEKRKKDITKRRYRAPSQRSKGSEDGQRTKGRSDEPDGRTEQSVDEATRLKNEGRGENACEALIVNNPHRVLSVLPLDGAGGGGGSVLVTSTPSSSDKSDSESERDISPLPNN